MNDQRATGVTPRTVAFPDDLWERAQHAAELLSVSTGAVVRVALEQFLGEPDHA